MMTIIKKILKSGIFRLLISVVLIYFAFYKVDAPFLFKQLVEINPLFVLANILISLVFITTVSYRWSLLLIKKPKVKDVLNFAKSTLTAAFYGLFLPTAVGADVLKWIIIDEKYPKIPKTKLLGSVMLDRFIGLSVYMVVGVIFIVIAKFKGIVIPNLIFLITLGIALACIVFYFLIYFGKIDFFVKKFKFLRKFENMISLIEKENLGQLLKGMILSVFSELGWALQLWFISWYFGAGLSIFSILIFVPIISLVLILPISIAGFGARENLFLFFFSRSGIADEKILLTSAFLGILTIMNSLVGGLVTLTGDFKRLNKK